MTPDDVDSLLIMAREQAGHGNRAQARRLLLRALSREPGHPEARAALLVLAVPPGPGRAELPAPPSGRLVLACAVALIGVILLLLGVQRSAGYACVAFAAVILLLRGGFPGKRSESGADCR